MTRILDAFFRRVNGYRARYKYEYLQLSWPENYWGIGEEAVHGEAINFFNLLGRRGINYGNSMRRRNPVICRRLNDVQKIALMINW